MTQHPDHDDAATGTNAPAPGTSTFPDTAVLVRSGCHLCADAVAVVEQVCSQLGAPWRLIQGEEQPELLDRYAEEVPVLFLDGVPRDFWRFDPVRLESMLRAGPGAGGVSAGSR